jgi:hypothetical protein
MILMLHVASVGVKTNASKTFIAISDGKNIWSLKHRWKYNIKMCFMQIE